MTETEWRERTFDAAIADAIAAHDPKLSAALARVLAARGVTAAGLDAFLNPPPVQPVSLPGVPEAVNIALAAVKAGEEIVVFGDYDADGVSASAILVTALSKIGAQKVAAFIPERLTEGYGMTAASLARLLREHPGVRLVITVDNGISSAAEVAGLRGKGIKVVVTDHHLPPGKDLPKADALVNPHVEAVPGAEDLCGAGVAFFLACALVRAAAERGLFAGAKFGGPLLVLAGVATVADVVPLTGQNRVLVANALRGFAAAPVGLKELLFCAQRTTRDLSARDLGFLVAPRLNAAGRMASAREAYDLVTATDREQARRLAVVVNGRNVERRTVEERMDREAREQAGLAAGVPFAAPALVVRGPVPEPPATGRQPPATGHEPPATGHEPPATSHEPPAPWHSGVAGIVAARLLEAVNVPVAVVVPGKDGAGHGSARAPEGYNVRDALAASSAALVRFGGHAAAGGFTVKPGAFDAFKTLFTAACAAQRAATPSAAALAFDGWLDPADITLDLCTALRRLEPFGEGNPEPVFGVRGVTLRDVRPLGADGKHLGCEFVERGLPRATWWRHGVDVEELRRHSGGRFDILFTVEASDFGGDPPHPELRLVDLRPAR